MKLKAKVQRRLEIITLIGLFISNGFVDERPFIAFIGLIIFGLCTCLLYKYGGFKYE